jgi:hypothetical protein
VSSTVLAEPTITAVCGSLAGARAHRERGERRCPSCEVVVERQRAVREGREARAARRAPVRRGSLRPARCGTVAGARRHREAGEPLCVACALEVAPVPGASVEDLLALVDAVVAAAGAHRAAEADMAAARAVNGVTGVLARARADALGGERAAVRALRAAICRAGGV